ncbi:MAG: L-threonylcarbamoyladenylate synthase [Acidobacteriota bacterium]
MSIAACDADGLARAAACLRAGGVVAFATDTVYGLAADPRQAAAVTRVFALKGRPEGVPLPLVAADVAQADAAAELDADARRLAGRFWPGPLSIVVPGRSLLAPGVRAADGTVAIRVPAQEGARALASALGFAITATSANPSGRPPARSAVEALTLLPAVDLVLDGGASVDGPPSTIVALRDGTPVLVRAGAVPWDRVVQFFR